MNSSIVALLLTLGVTVPLSGQTPRDDRISPCDLATSGASDWMMLSERQSPPRLVIAAEHLPRKMELIACAEAIYTESGLDSVTESQWTLVLVVVVSPEGMVERFRILHQPPIGTDLRGPTKEALRQWRYRPVMFKGAVHPICLAIALPKPLGSRASAACGTTKKEPPNQAAAVGREPPPRSGPRR
jgi:hypothetical protein